MSCTKILKHRQLNAWRTEINTCTENLFQNEHFLNGSQSQKLQETRNKKNRIKEN